MPSDRSGVDWQTWLTTWDRQQEHLLPDREERFSVMLDIVEAVVGAPGRVLDLASGPGSITIRLLRRFPAAQATLVDVDPSLLAVANGVLGRDRRVTIVRADLSDPAWRQQFASDAFDAVVTANSLHWLPEPDLRRVYRDVAEMVRPGGVFCNADPMAPEGAQRIIAALRVRDDARRRTVPEGEMDWGAWWEAAAADPTLGPLVAERNARFGGDHPPEFTPPLSWHREALLDAVFSEAGCIWRRGEGAIVAAIR